ncbi:(2Fe-2S)-binding protein [bacterium]|nr:(2Fe-2S)-binding protein [bacterium]
MEKQIECVINGRTVSLVVETHWTLSFMIREKLGLTGTKEACGEGECGSCTVLVDGDAFNSCLYLAADADGKTITTIEGLADGDKLHPLQQAFVDRGAIQCGFCTPGMVLTAKAMLDKSPDLSAEAVRYHMAGNLCRCTGYDKIFEAITEARDQMKKGDQTTC